MLKSSMLRVFSGIAIALILNSCAAMKKGAKQTSTPATEQNPVTNTQEATRTATGRIHTVNPEQFNKLLLLNKVQLVDVRTQEEFQTGHIKDAINIDVKDANFQANTSKLNKDQPVLVYCRSGKRSGEAAEVLKQLGFKKIVSLDGGIISWEEANLPIKK